MRILVVSHGFPPHAQGGAEIYAELHARTLAGAFGDTVHVLTREQRADRPEYSVRTEIRERLTITWINNTFRETRSFEDSYRSPRIARIAQRVIDEFGPDAAHIHHLTCLSTEIPRMLASRGVPVYLTLHDHWLMCHRGQLLNRDYKVCDGPGESGCGSCVGLMPVIDRYFERHRVAHMREVCGHVTRFLAPSRSIRDRFIQFGIAPERIELSPYGFDIDSFTPRAAAARGGPLRIGFLGTLMISKGPHVLLEAVRQLPQGAATVDLLGAQADYHGDTSYRGVLEPLLRSPNVRVRGPQSRDQVAAALASFDVLVVPSIWPENSPLVVHEAFLASVPVVASNIGGIPELVEHERNGLLFDAGNADALRRALLRLVEDPGLLERLAAGAAATRVRSIEDAVVRGVRPQADRTRLAAVVLNYRTADDTAIAVASLLASDRPPDEVIVVDNDEATDCRAALRQWAAAITYISTGRNLGFAGGMNAGVRHALQRGAAAVLLVNSDVVVPPDCIARLERALRADARTGIVGPRILSRARPDLVGSLGIDYNVDTGRMRHRVEGGNAEVNAVSGCLMLVAGNVFERAGFLDERYFFSFEEIDFCLRARAAGFVTRLVADAVAYHEGSQAIGKASARRFYFAARNHLMLARAHGGNATFVAALNVAHAIKAPGGSLRARLGATLRGVADHVRGRYGADRAARPL